MELDAIVSMEFHGTFPLNSIEIDVLIPHGMPWKFFPRISMEFHGGISYGMYQVIQRAFITLFSTFLKRLSVFSNQLNSKNKTTFRH